MGQAKKRGSFEERKQQALNERNTRRLKFENAEQARKLNMTEEEKLIEQRSNMYAMMLLGLSGIASEEHAHTMNVMKATSESIKLFDTMQKTKAEMLDLIEVPEC